MLAPQPGQTAKFPRPIKIISKAALLEAWNKSRDSKKNPGRPGVDNVTAQQFKAKLETNLLQVTKSISKRSFGFSKLRAVFIPKPNSDKERIICIPTVKDRLIQRVIVEYVTSKRLFPIYNSSSFGFIKERGTHEAIDAVIRLRSKYKWCLKTDIEAFFDRVPREYLKALVRKYLGRHSITKLICDAIDCEAQITGENKSRLLKQGIKAGVGIRQGMPLSPLLANLALVNFDRQIRDADIEMVRYADDLVLFFESKQDAIEGQQLVKEALKRMQLTIPEIADGSKTSIISHETPLEFLGREIVFKGKTNTYVSRIGNKQIEKIKSRLYADYSLAKRLRDKKTFQDTVVDMTKSMSAYLGIYKDAYNYIQFDGDLRGQSRAIIRQLFKDIFGQDALSSLTDDSKKCLGIDILDSVAPNPDLDI
jgi:group II intron reverse transcriptase/maturase